MLISTNYQIRWENRLNNDIRNTCLVSVDGVDFRVKGKKLFSGEPDPSYYSYKFKGPGLCYLVALSIRSSDIVYVAGPYFPGEYNDLEVLRDCGILDDLEPTEKIEADDGYMGECPRYCLCPGWHGIRVDQMEMRARV